MNARAIKGLHYEWYLEILSKLLEPLAECNWKTFQISRVVQILLNWLSFHTIQMTPPCKWPIPHRLPITVWMHRVLSFSFSYLCLKYSNSSCRIRSLSWTYQTVTIKETSQMLVKQNQIKINKNKIDKKITLFKCQSLALWHLIAIIHTRWLT